MRHIPTANEPEELKKVYKAEYGDTAYEYVHDHYEFLEYRLLNDAYQERFSGDGFPLFMFNHMSIRELNSVIRGCVDTDTPFKQPDYPKGVLF